MEKIKNECIAQVDEFAGRFQSNWLILPVKIILHFPFNDLSPASAFSLGTQRWGDIELWTEWELIAVRERTPFRKGHRAPSLES